MHDGMPYGRIQGQGQGHSKEVDRQSRTGLIFILTSTIGQKCLQIVQVTPYGTSSIRGRYFAERTVCVWNFLPSSVNFSKLDAFRHSLVSVDFSSFIKCNTE